MNFKFRKLTSLIVSISLTLTLLVGCNQNTNTNQKSASNTNGQSANNSLKEANTDKAQIEKIIKELTSEKYKGRLSGSDGNKLAEEYIANYYKEIGLKNLEALNNYRQPFDMRVRNISKTPKLQLLDSKGSLLKEYKYLKDFNVVTSANNIKTQGDAAAALTVIDDLTKESNRNDINGKFALIPELTRRSVIYSDFINKIVSTCEKDNMLGVISEYNLASRGYTSFAVTPNVVAGNTPDNKGPFLLYVDSPIYAEMVKETEKGASVNVSIDFSIDNISVNNVIGYIPGSDDKLKDEYVLVSAHFDHVGDNKDGTYNPGGFDNGSGLAGLMEIAKVLNEKKIKPKKSIVFIAFNGEEEGLYGSYSYCEMPAFPLDKSTVVNMDMIGSKAEMPLTIFTASGSDNSLQSEFVKYAEELKIPTEIKFNEYSNADHAPFCENAVKAITLINEDFSIYHSPLDTADNVNLDRLKQITDLVLYYINKTAY